MMHDDIPEGVNWLPQEEYNKTVGQLRMSAYGIFDFLKVDNKVPVRYMYGTEVFVHGAVQEIVRLAEDFGLRVRGVDKMFSVEAIRHSRGAGNGRKES